MAHKALQQSEALIQQRREELEQRYREKEREARREVSRYGIGNDT